MATQVIQMSEDGKRVERVASSGSGLSPKLVAALTSLGVLQVRISLNLPVSP